MDCSGSRQGGGHKRRVFGKHGAGDNGVLVN